MKIKIANQQNRICYEYNSYCKSWKKIYPKKQPKETQPTYMEDRLHWDTYIDERGYKRFEKDGKLVHRYIIENKLNRKLKRSEVVHHINQSKQNNKIENLRVMSWADHNYLHESEWEDEELEIDCDEDCDGDCDECDWD